MMECLFLSPAPQGRRVCLYAVPDGVPLYFKHNELAQQPGHRLLWRGNPQAISEQEAASLVATLAAAPPMYRNYQGPPDAAAGFETAKESFLSATKQLGQQLEYAPGTYPNEVLVGEELT